VVVPWHLPLKVGAASQVNSEIQGLEHVLPIAGCPLKVNVTMDDKEVEIDEIVKDTNNNEVKQDIPWWILQR